jgi:nucleoside-diphosphate-sugar epimerase
MSIPEKIYFITGGNGILGTELIAQLKLSDSTRVQIMSRQDLLDKDYFQKFTKSYFEGELNTPTLVHLAWPVADKDFRHSQENIEFLEKSVNLMSRFKSVFPKGKIVGIGTFLEYGNSLELFDESKLDPETKYAEAKAKLFQWMNNNLAENYTWGRICTMVSGRDPVFKVTKQALTNSNFGCQNPYTFEDFIHVSDVSKALMSILDSNTKGQVLVGTGRTISVLSYVNSLKNLQKFPLETPIYQEDMKVLHTHPNRLRAIGWRPRLITELEISTSILKEYESLNL